MKKKISVAMTTYNGEKYLREQLESLYLQTLVPDEIVVVDDCSIDNTKDVLEEYHNKFGLIYHINEKNLGVNKNFEKAITLCSGEYIALCDQDDVWMSHKLEISYKRLISIEKNRPSLVSSRCIEVDTNLNILSTPSQAKDSDSYVSTLLGHHSQGCSLMMNRKLIKYIIPFPSDDQILFDVYIGLTAAMVGNKYNIAEPLMYYRHHFSNVLFRIDTGRFSLRQKLRNRFINRYPLLVSERRLYNMREVAKQQSQHFIPERISLYNKLLLLDSKTSIFQKIKIVLSIKELPLPRRFITLATTIISHFIRKII